MQLAVARAYLVFPELAMCDLLATADGFGRHILQMWHIATRQGQTGSVIWVWQCHWGADQHWRCGSAISWVVSRIGKCRQRELLRWWGLSTAGSKGMGNAKLMVREERIIGRLRSAARSHTHIRSQSIATCAKTANIKGKVFCRLVLRGRDQR